MPWNEYAEREEDTPKETLRVIGLERNCDGFIPLEPGLTALEHYTEWREERDADREEARHQAELKRMREAASEEQVRWKSDRKWRIGELISDPDGDGGGWGCGSSARERLALGGGAPFSRRVAGGVTRTARRPRTGAVRRTGRHTARQAQRCPRTALLNRPSRGRGIGT